MTISKILILMEVWRNERRKHSRGWASSNYGNGISFEERKILEEILNNSSRGYDFDFTPKEIDEDGRVRFEDLDVGLYLVLQASQGKGEDNKYVITPFLISIPCRNPDGSLLYDVDAKSKPLGIAKEKKPSPPKPPILPQTSQLWWPVMALGAVGLLFLFAGMARKKRSS